MSSGPGQVAVLGRAQEAEAVGQDLEHALGEDQAFLLRLRAQDLEDQLLLLHGGGAGDLQALGHLGQLGDAHLLERGQVQAVALGRRRGGRRLRRATGAGSGAAGRRSPPRAPTGAAGPPGLRARPRAPLGRRGRSRLGRRLGLRLGGSGSAVATAGSAALASSRARLARTFAAGTAAPATGPPWCWKRILLRPCRYSMGREGREEDGGARVLPPGLSAG